MLVDNTLLADMFPGVIRSIHKENRFTPVNVNGEDLIGMASASVSRNGNFTIAVIDFCGGSFVGVAKRNPLDTPNAKRGDCIALSRALKNLVLSGNFNAF